MKKNRDKAFKIYKSVLFHINGWSRKDAEELEMYDCEDEMFEEFVEILNE